MDDTLQQLETKNENNIIEISKGDIDISADAEAKNIQPKAGSYVIGLVNLTNNCYTLIRTKGSNGQWGNWSSMPMTCRNCTTNYDDCANNGKYSPILVTPCNSPAFSLQIAYLGGDGSYYGATYDNITPNCNYAGGLIGIY